MPRVDVEITAAEMRDWNLLSDLRRECATTANANAIFVLEGNGVVLTGRLRDSVTGEGNTRVLTLHVLTDDTRDLGAMLRALVDVPVADPRRVSDPTFVEEWDLVQTYVERRRVRMVRKAAAVAASAAIEALIPPAFRTWTAAQIDSQVDSRFANHNAQQRSFLKGLLAAIRSGGVG